MDMEGNEKVAFKLIIAYTQKYNNFVKLLILVRLLNIWHIQLSYILSY